MSDEELSALRVKVRLTHIDSPMDVKLELAVRYFARNIADFEAGAASPRRAYFVVGPAGTGKTTAIRHAVSRNPAFQPRRSEHGELQFPYVYVKLPKKCATLDMVKATLDVMNLPTDGSEKSLTDLLKSQLRKRGTKVLHLDELQHTVRSNTRAAFEAAQDFIKELVDRDDWPLHAFFSGMPLIENMRQDGQVERRSLVVPFHSMEFKDDEHRYEMLLDQIVVKSCGFRLDDVLLTAEFRERLCHATRGAWGTAIETIQSATFHALEKRKSVLSRNDFAYAYEATSGAPRDKNVFVAKNFRDITPEHSLSSMLEE